MKTIFDKKTLVELISRINCMEVNSQSLWGKMDAFQMLRHCTMSEEMFLGRRQYKRLFAGKLFGRMALKGIMKNEEPIKKNLPTHPEMKITGNGDFEAERTRWIELLQAYPYMPDSHFIHPFFGQMGMEQIGKYVYKHTDHHLRQFGH